MSARNIWYSTLQFRIHPGDPVNDVLDLGLAIEFTTSRYWVVGLFLRATLDETYVAHLDGLSRKLRAERMAVLTREIEQILPKAKQRVTRLPIWHRVTRGPFTSPRRDRVNCPKATKKHPTRQLLRSWRRTIC